MKCFRCNQWPCECRDGIALVHGDCLEVMPCLQAGSFDCVLTDPPWKAGKGGRIHRREGETINGVAPSRLSTSLAYGDIGYFAPEAILEVGRISGGDILVLCGFMELPEVIASIRRYRGVLIWHNTRPTPIPGPVASRDVAYVVWGGEKTTINPAVERWPSCLFRHGAPQSGCMATERILNKDGTTAHPAQEPINLFIDLLKPLNGSVLDPYVGSGTTLAALKKLGRSGMGIELEERYCEIAAKRLEQEVFQFTD